jgi:phospholipase C
MSGFRAGLARMRLSALMALLTALALVVSSSSQSHLVPTANAAPSAAGLEKINHIIVLYEENHSFDNLYGQFPGANGIAQAKTEQLLQVDKEGQAYKILPAPLAAPVNAVRNPDQRFPAELPNRPFLLNTFVSPDDKTGDMIHAFYREQYQIDGGKMDRFATWSDGAGLAMGYWDTSGLPLYELAKQYTVDDNFFHAAFGGSFLNHFWLVCACTPVWTGDPAPADMLSVPFPNDAEHLQDKNLTADGYLVNTSFSVNTPRPATVAADHLVPNQTMPTIGDRLTAAGISWAWFAGGWNAALAGQADPLFQYHHHPFTYFANFADGTPAKAEHLLDTTDFNAALANSTLPAVSFVKPLGPDNEHPGYANISQGEAWAAKLIQAVQQSPSWNDTAIIVTYDEHGGSWDHVAPQVADRWGPGLRVPTIVISPFARKGYVDHTSYDTTAILKLIETRWGLAPLGSRDAAAGDLLTSFDFNQAPLRAPSQLPGPRS